MLERQYQTFAKDTHARSKVTTSCMPKYCTACRQSGHMFSDNNSSGRIFRKIRVVCIKITWSSKEKYLVVFSIGCEQSASSYSIVYIYVNEIPVSGPINIWGLRLAWWSKWTRHSLSSSREQAWISASCHRRWWWYLLFRFSSKVDDGYSDPQWMSMDACRL